MYIVFNDSSNYIRFIIVLICLPLLGLEFLGDRTVATPFSYRPQVSLTCCNGHGHFLTFSRYCCLVAKSCLILCDRMDYSPPGSSVHGISQAKILEWFAISFSGIFLTQGSNLCLLHCQVDSLSLSYLGIPRVHAYVSK